LEIGHSLLFLILIIAAAKIGGEIAEYLGQPAVTGELVVGVLLGLTGLRAAAHDPAIAFVAAIGIIILLFEAGLESELDEFLKVRYSATLVALIGVALPFAGGFLLTFGLTKMPSQALFLGAVLTATSVGITARVLSDARAMNTVEAKITLGAAVIDDILGLLILSSVLEITSGGKQSPLSIAGTMTLAIVFLVVAVVAGIRFAPSLIRLAQRLRTRGVLVSVAFLFCLTLAYLSEHLGLAEIVGAFAAGLVLASTDDRVKIHQQIKPLTDIFTPVFFVLVGLQVDLAALNPFDAANRSGLLVGLGLLVLAIGGKLAAGWGVREKDANKLAVGVAMIPRGEVGLIFASVGLQSHIIGANLYTQIILVILATTLIAPPWLRRVLNARNAMGITNSS
jgi:Kef-type K+ transport system membrane component KefB